MIVTAKIIAEQLNLSTATVDRALNKRNGVSPKTVRKVLDKAKELNYKPNKSASFLAKKKTYVLLLFSLYIQSIFGKKLSLG